MSIDDKLREILSTNHDIVGEGATVRFNYDAEIAQIKQAFADEGYLQIPQVSISKDAEPFSGHPGGGYVDINNKPFMSGRDWYDRFQKELHTIRDNPEAFDHRVFEAAKRAAGLSDE